MHGMSLVYTNPCGVKSNFHFVQIISLPILELQKYFNCLQFGLHVYCLSFYCFCL